MVMVLPMRKAVMNTHDTLRISFFAWLCCSMEVVVGLDSRVVDSAGRIINDDRKTVQNRKTYIWLQGRKV